MSEKKSELRGGKRKGAGRKSKSDEQKMIEKLTPMEDTALLALQMALSNGEHWAVNLFFKYYFGLPKVKIDHTTNGDSIQPIILNFIQDNGDDITDVNYIDVDDDNIIEE